MRLNGYYIKVVNTDKIYGNLRNRQWLTELGIRYSGKALCQPSTQSQIAYQRRKYIKKQWKRNEVEDKFGQCKNAYNLNRVRAKTATTSENWIAAIFFVMNLIKLIKEFLSSILKTLLDSLNPVLKSFVLQW